MTAPLEYGTPPAIPRWARWLMRPIGWPFYAAAIALFLLILYLAITPDNFGVVAAIVFLGGPLAVLYMLRLGLFLLLNRIYKQRPPGALFGTMRFVVILIVPAVLAVLLMLEVPFRVALRLSEAALEREAKAILAASPPTGAASSYSGCRVGAFNVRCRYYSANDELVLFRVEGAGFLDDVGIAYSPKRPPKPGDAHALEYQHIRGPWYRYRASIF